MGEVDLGLSLRWRGETRSRSAALNTGAVLPRWRVTRRRCQVVPDTVYPRWRGEHFASIARQRFTVGAYPRSGAGKTHAPVLVTKSPPSVVSRQVRGYAAHKALSGWRRLFILAGAKRTVGCNAD